MKYWDQELPILAAANQAYSGHEQTFLDSVDEEKHSFSLPLKKK